MGKNKSRQKNTNSTAQGVSLVFERVAFLDVHRDTVVACVRVPGSDSLRAEYIETFGTMTGDLLSLKDWLGSNQVTYVGMESTGVFWKPVYYLLEDSFELLLVNARDMHNVPGKKTDVKDSAWGCQLMECGLLRGSFVPPKPIRELRDLTRHRQVLIHERARAIQRLHKLLQDAGIKLSSVATDIMGVSGRNMIEALVTGNSDANALAELARGRLRAKLPLLRRALQGKFSSHHAFITSEILAQIDFLEESMERLTEHIQEIMRPFAEAAAILKTMTGIQDKAAEALIAEIGVDMSKFPSDKHIASWAGMCPGNNESAGKHKSGKTRKGNRWLRPLLVEVALAAIRSKDSYFAAQYRRIVPRRGHKKAIVAVAHSILVVAYHLLKNKATYKDLGAQYFEQKDHSAIRRRCVRQLERLGYEVNLTQPEAAA